MDEGGQVEITVNHTKNGGGGTFPVYLVRANSSSADYRDDFEIPVPPDGTNRPIEGPGEPLLMLLGIGSNTADKKTFNINALTDGVDESAETIELEFLTDLSGTGLTSLPDEDEDGNPITASPDVLKNIRVVDDQSDPDPTNHKYSRTIITINNVAPTTTAEPTTTATPTVAPNTDHHSRTHHHCHATGSGAG